MAERRLKAKHGFGAKRLFFSVLKAHFAKAQNRNRLLAVFGGAACEQWINAEWYTALRAARPRAWIESEWKKTDLSLFTSNEADAPEAIFETKLLYAKYSPAKQGEKLDELVAQLKKAQGLLDATAPRSNVVGIVVSFDWTYADGTRVRSKVSSRDRLPRSLVTDRGLVNAFGHSGGYHVRGVLASSTGPIDVDVRFEAVRLADAGADG